MGAPPPERLTQPTPGLTPHPHEMAPMLTGDNEAAHLSEIGSVPPRYVSIYTPLHSAQFVNLDAYSQDRKHDEDFDPDLLADEGTCTG